MREQNQTHLQTGGLQKPRKQNDGRKEFSAVISQIINFAGPCFVPQEVDGL
ncbi:hypothetical protein [Desulfocastanea catecholica]